MAPATKKQQQVFMQAAQQRVPLPTDRGSSSVHVYEDAGFDDIYDKYVEFVRCNVCRLGICDANADDVVQKVFLVVARRLSDFERRSSVKTWLFSILLRVVREERRSMRRKLRHWWRNDNADPDELPHAEGRTSYDAFSRAEAAALVQRLLNELEPEKREVFVLVELEEMTAKEVSEVTGLAIPKVYSRLRAARTDFERAASKLRRTERLAPR